MRMSNFLGVEPLASPVMATSQKRIGIAHVTVVPTNADVGDADGVESAAEQPNSDADE